MMRIVPAHEVEQRDLDKFAKGIDKFFPTKYLNCSMLYRADSDLSFVLGDLFASDDPYELWGDVFAFGMVRGWHDNWDEKVLGLCVHDRARGKGLGTMMLNWLEWCAKRRGLSRLRLHVHPDNKIAKHLYHKHGWKHEAEREDGEEIWRKRLT